MTPEENRIKVTILTGNYRIKGAIETMPGGRRVTDYMSNASAFVTIHNAEVWESGGRQVFALPLIHVHRDHIQIIAPAS